MPFRVMRNGFFFRDAKGAGIVEIHVGTPGTCPAALAIRQAAPSSGSVSVTPAAGFGITTRHA